MICLSKSKPYPAESCAFGNYCLYTQNKTCIELNSKYPGRNELTNECME